MSPRSKQLLFAAAWMWLLLGVTAAVLLRKQAARTVPARRAEEEWRELSDQELGA